MLEKTKLCYAPSVESISKSMVNCHNSKEIKTHRICSDLLFKTMKEEFALEQEQKN